MDAQPPLVMSFPGLDEAESALDWIGVDFADADGGFEGELTADDRELLDIAHECGAETDRQLTWLTTRLKVAAPQALIVAP